MGTQDGHIQLCWDQFQTNMTSSFKNVRSSQDFCDVTLVSEDGSLVEAHRVILTASSKFFQNILSPPTSVRHKHPLIFLSGVKSDYLNSVLDFLYCGEASVEQSNLYSFLEVAKILQIKGLIEAENLNNTTKQTVQNIWQIKKENCENDKLKWPENLQNYSEEGDMNIQDENIDAGKFDENVQKDLDETTITEISLPTESNTKKRKLKEDMFIISNDKTICKVCDFVTDDTDEMKKHIETHVQTFEYLKARKRQHRSEVWDFATKIGSHAATCTLCDKQISCKNGTTSNIQHHLNSVHGKILNGFQARPEDPEQKKKKSAVWNFATKGENCATCNICNKTVRAMRGTTTNIMIHIKTKHKDEVTKYNLSRSELSNEKSIKFE